MAIPAGGELARPTLALRGQERAAPAPTELKKKQKEKTKERKRKTSLKERPEEMVQGATEEALLLPSHLWNCGESTGGVVAQAQRGPCASDG